MTTLGTKDQRLARLESLLERVQVNALALRRERAGGEVVTVSSPQPGSQPSSGVPITAPTGTVPPRPALGTLPDFLAQAEVAPAPVANFGHVGPDTGTFDAGEPATQLFAPIVTEEPAVPGLDPAFTEPQLALDSLDSDLPTLPPSRDDDFEDPSAEHTKPLWLGLNNDPGTLSKDGGSADKPGDSHRTLAETPAAKVSDTLEFSTHEAEAATSEPLIQEPAQPPNEITEDGGLDIAAFDRGFGEEEYIDTNPPISGHRPSSRDLDLTAEHELAEEGGEQELEVLPTDFDASEARLSDAPPSVIGATITLPEDSSAMALELVEHPPSAAPSSETSPRDELEAELPRTSFRAEYDASLAPPPSALEDLRAHDRAEQERRSAESRASFATERMSIPPLQDDDLPPVLSSRPASPSAQPGAQANAVVYKPEPGIEPAVYEGARPALRSLAFLELLDASLAITPRSS